MAGVRLKQITASGISAGGTLGFDGTAWSAQNRNLRNPRVVSSHLYMSGFTGNMLGATWPTANLAMFVPFILDDTTIVNQFAWMNTASLGGNVDAGVYSEDGTRLVSIGGTAQAGSTQAQVVSITTTSLDAGRYWMAISKSTATGQFYHISLNGSPTLPRLLMGVKEMSSAYPLPSVATLSDPAPASTLAPPILWLGVS